MSIEIMRSVIADAISNPAGTCARQCEGNAYRIEIRRLNSRVEELEAALISKHAQVETLNLAIQAASAAMSAAPIVSQFHRDEIRFLKECKE